MRWVLFGEGKTELEGNRVTHENGRMNKYFYSKHFNIIAATLN